MFFSGSKYIFLFLSVTFLYGCSPEAGKKTLNFFFDGVPADETGQLAALDSLSNPDSVLSVSNTPLKPQKTYHLPWLEKECASCHDQNSMGKYVMPQPGLCYQCHEDFKDNYNIVHGPVAGGYCTACHHPHFAKEEGLLKRSGQELCLLCHIPGEGFNSELHDGIEDTDCTECHDPHGGETRLMFN